MGAMKAPSATQAKKSLKAQPMKAVKAPLAAQAKKSMKAQAIKARKAPSSAKAKKAQAMTAMKAASKAAAKATVKAKVAAPVKAVKEAKKPVKAGTAAERAEWEANDALLFKGVRAQEWVKNFRALVKASDGTTYEKCSAMNALRKVSQKANGWCRKALALKPKAFAGAAGATALALMQAAKGKKTVAPKAVAKRTVKARAAAPVKTVKEEREGRALVVNASPHSMGVSPGTDEEILRLFQSGAATDLISEALESSDAECPTVTRKMMSAAGQMGEMTGSGALQKMVVRRDSEERSSSYKTPPRRRKHSLSADKVVYSDSN